jgi:electron transfer flavoprotein beta subunit
MKIIVCVKEIIDPELPPDNFNIDPTRNIPLTPASVPTVLSPFDGQAVEAALRIKDINKEGRVTVQGAKNSLT